MGVGDRNFQRYGMIIKQEPRRQLLEPFEAEFGKVKARLKIELRLSYLAVLDPGMDRFLCKLYIKRPARWQGSDKETLALEREFLRLDVIIDWLSGLQGPIIGALFNDCREDIKDSDPIRVLLALVDQIRPLGVALAEDEKIRRKMLE